jgi:hypothetical protein
MTAPANNESPRLAPRPPCYLFQSLCQERSPMAPHPPRRTRRGQRHPGSTPPPATRCLPSFHWRRLPQRRLSQGLRPVPRHDHRGRVHASRRTRPRFHCVGHGSRTAGCLRCLGGFLLDGFPRTLSQAVSLNQLLQQEKLCLSAIVNYELPMQEIVSCQKCKALFHITSQPPKSESICDHCGAALYQREDDRPESIAARLEA